MQSEPESAAISRMKWLLGDRNHEIHSLRAELDRSRSSASRDLARARTAQEVCEAEVACWRDQSRADRCQLDRVNELYRGLQQELAGVARGEDEGELQRIRDEHHDSELRQLRQDNHALRAQLGRVIPELEAAVYRNASLMAEMKVDGSANNSRRGPEVTHLADAVVSKGCLGKGCGEQQDGDRLLTAMRYFEETLPFGDP
eukprot:TRINITY_DN8_c0_g2_i1.p1 TRINITY_DN8_c0_g2~~TRINITY_DN8_c0_g2_i1.p1  ORF type:complete len:201 (+),score=30.29 TRINITY_DN8_c0_g2_i1:311-913(+)